ncbi:S9 family peptidase [Nemorincola caseinilytica]|uniref:S9 family peptidase n=1 Tax=Nemorincola caseinilytica TaxID=2054315 RepID=A0ABP8NP23_9BACT
MKKTFITLSMLCAAMAQAQNRLMPETLWSLHRVGGNSMSPDGKYVYYTSKSVDWKTEKSTTHHYKLNLADDSRREVTTEGRTITQRYDKAWFAYNDNVLYESNDSGNTWKEIFNGLQGAENVWVSPNGKYVAFSKDVMIKAANGTDIYSDLPNTTAKVYTDLNYRHWDTWEDGKYSHIFFADLKAGTVKDLMEDEPYDSPQKPFGGGEDLAWAPDSKGFVYVCKKKVGKDYAISTNTDLYFYSINTGKTTNWSEGRMGYDTQPIFSPDGKRLAWLSMGRDGYEADKNDILVMDVATKKIMNATSHWDGTAEGFIWDNGGEKLYFNAPFEGTVQLFDVAVPRTDRDKPAVNNITKGKYDINGIVGLAGNGEVIVSRTDMNHAAELYAVKPKYGDMRQITHENDRMYNDILMSKTELKSIRTPDGATLRAWVIYPPDFDPNKKYPTLLYCQGGPQSPLSQFYSVRWNFQLMAAQGYIVVAPNRRGMPGWGVQWNEAISKDWGGLPMQDYLTAIDEVAKAPYVDKNRLGCVGASYGGYSVFMLAGMHNNRFKSFIAHDGLFDLKSWYGTTEELWFANWDIGGAYWKQPVPSSYEKFNPSNFVNKWNTPIMIVQGGLDYRVPIEQGLEAFQAAQLHGIKSKLLYLPNENHWVLHPQNGIAWQREFFKWLDETLK